MIHYVCVATKSKLYFPYLKQLLPELTVLGMGTKWKGFIMKYELLGEYLKILNNDNDIVCFIDAYDILPTKNTLNRTILIILNNFNDCLTLYLYLVTWWYFLHIVCFAYR